MSCCPRLGCGTRASYDSNDGFPLPNRLLTTRRSASPAAHHEPRRALSPNLIVPPSPILISQLVAEPVTTVAAVLGDSDNEDGRVRSATPKSLHTPIFGALRTKISRRLSQKTYLKKDPRHKVGTSQEELARRAELKRARRKRIERELHHDGQDQDAVDTELEQDGATIKEPYASGFRDAVEFDICTNLNAPSPNADKNKNVQAGIGDATRENIDPDKTLHRRSSCPVSLLRLPSLMQLSPKLREHTSLSQMPSQGVQVLELQASRVMGTGSSRCLLPDIVPVVFDDPQDMFIEAREAESIKEPTTGDEATEDKTYGPAEVALVEISPAPQPLPVVKVELLQETSPQDASIFDIDTFDAGYGTDLPLELWLRSQGIQPLSLRSSKTSDSNLSIQQDTVRTTSSKVSYDSKVHALPLKQRSHNRIRLFPSQQTTQPYRAPSSHMILSSEGLQLGSLIQSSPDNRLRSDSRCGSSAYPRRDINPLDPTGANDEQENLRLDDVGRANESRSSSYATAFTTLDTMRVTSRLASRPWWHAPEPSGVAAEPESASFRLRESELSSVAARFAVHRTASQASAPVASKFHENFSTKRRSKEYRLPMLLKIQTLFKPPSQKRRATYNHSPVSMAQPSQLPTSAFVLDPADNLGRPKKVRLWQRFVTAGSPGSYTEADAAFSLPYGVELKSADTPKQEASKRPTRAANVQTGRSLPPTILQDLDSPNVHVQCHELSADETCKKAVQTRPGDEMFANSRELGKPPTNIGKELSSRVLGFLNDVECSKDHSVSVSTYNSESPKTRSLCAERQHASTSSDQELTSSIGGLKRSKSTVEPRPSIRRARPDKFMTWHGAPARQRILFESTLEFSAQLEKALADAKLMALQ